MLEVDCELKIEVSATGQSLAEVRSDIIAYIESRCHTGLLGRVKDTTVNSVKITRMKVDLMNY